MNKIWNILKARPVLGLGLLVLISLCVVERYFFEYISDAQCEAENIFQHPIETVTHFDKIELSYGVCFGPCPVYKVTIYGDGNVNYVGVDNVKIRGGARSRLNQDQLSALVAALNASKILSSGNIPSNRTITSIDNGEGPMNSIFVTANGKNHQEIFGFENLEYEIKNWPCQKLAPFLKIIDDMIDVEKWIGTPEERKGYAL